MGMRLLLAGLLLLQDGSLIDRLGHDDPAVRAEAFEALEKKGSAAVPELRRALTHRSPEVRARATDLLRHLPPFQGSHLLRHPEFARAKRIWNGLIGCLIHKDPVPAALWKELGDLAIHHEQEAVCSGEGIAPHPEAWILAQLAESGGKDLRFLAQKYGVEGMKDDLLVARQGAKMKPLPPDLFPRLAALRPDWDTLEEVYGSLLILRNQGLASWMNAFADRDWDTALLFLVRIRRRPDAKPATPLGKEGITKQIRRGPIVRGIARGLGRAFANPGKKYDRASCTDEQIRMTVARKSEWRFVEVGYRMLLDMERDISRCWFWKDRLRPTAAATPKRREGLHPFRKMPYFLIIRDEGRLDEAGLRVVAALLRELPSQHWIESWMEILAEIGRQVSKDAR